MAANRRQQGENTGGEELLSGQIAGTPAGQLMGFGHLLRTWRRTADVTQPVAAKALGMSERTYRKVERGATPPRFSREQCEALSNALKLDRDERHALLLYNVGGALAASSAEEHPQLRRALRLLIDRQMPSPTYLCDRNWNIIAFNATMAAWWPWVTEPGANLQRWALTEPDARIQYDDWDKHASAYIKMLKFAQTTRRACDPELEELIEDVKKNPAVRRLWDAEKELSENRDGHVFRMVVPALQYETVEVVSHVLYPASMPDCRLVVITWIETDEDDEETDALGGVRNGWVSAGSPPSAYKESIVGKQRADDAYGPPARLGVVASAEDAARLAGDGAIALPVLSRLVGDNCQLTLSPQAGSVVWALQESQEEWVVSEVDTHTVLARLARANFIDDARLEMKLVTRACMPTNPQEAIARTEEVIPLLQQRIRIVESIRQDLQEQEGTQRRDTRPAARSN